MDDLVSVGRHNYASGSGAGTWNTISSIRSLPIDGGDVAATKIINTQAYSTRGMDAASGTRLDTYTRADAAPGSTAWGSASQVTTGPTQTITPTVVTSGKKIQWRVDFVNPSGVYPGQKVGVLDAVRIETWRIATAFRVLHLDVSYGDDPYGSDTTRSPDQITQALKDLTESGRTTLRLPASDSRWVVKQFQVLDIVETLTPGAGTYGKSVKARIVLAALATA